MLQQIKNDLTGLGDSERAKNLSRFFKTGKGDYGEGDIFIGITVPEQRKVADKYIDLALNDLRKLLESRIHEYRLTALLILVSKYKKADYAGKDEIFSFYLRNLKGINNWDLVDLSAPRILGDFLLKRDRGVLFKLAKSKNLWERRIAVLSTFAFIENNDFEDALSIAKRLLNDEHDLIHKAVGWMLREIGKKDRGTEDRFLRKYSSQMPRVMLSYAIEKFDEETRKKYLAHTKHKEM